MKQKTHLRIKLSFNHILVVLIILFSNCSFGQVAFPCKDLNSSGNVLLNNGTYNIQEYCITAGKPNNTYNVGGDAKVTLTADKYINFDPGVSAEAFNSGFLDAKINQTSLPGAVILEPNSTQVPKHDKLEVGLILSDEINQSVQNYFNSVGTLKNNPFDPDNINVEATFTSPSGISKKVYGFYYDEFKRGELNEENREWIAAQTLYHWRLRFAPDEIGQWQISVSVIAKGCNTFTTTGLKFDCVSSTKSGNLEVSTNTRYLRYKDSKKSFFGIGQNIAWPAWYIDPIWCGLNLSRPIDYATFLDNVHNLGLNKGNFTRIVLNTVWSHGIEFERLGDYRDTKTNAHSWELDRYFDQLNAEDIKSVICMQMHSQFQIGNTDWDRSMDWHLNPYNSNSGKNTKIPGINSVSDFFSNPEAKKQFKKYLRYLVARWGYSTNIAYWQVFSEAELVDGYSSINDSWQIEMATFVKSIDSKHIVSTSYQGLTSVPPETKISKYANPIFEISGFHSYVELKRANIDSRWDAVNKESPGYRTKLSKPFMFDEIGSASSGCNIIEMHNTYWATAFMGGLGAGLNWFEAGNDAYRAGIFPRMNDFFKNIDFENQSFIPQKFPQKGIKYENLQYLEAFTLVKSNKTRAYGWVQNRYNYWGNLSCLTQCPAVCQPTCVQSLLPCPTDDPNCGVTQVSYGNDYITIND